MRLCILGGGGFRVPLVYRALAAGPYPGLITELVLHDTDTLRLDGILRVLASMPLPDGARPPVVRACAALDEALAGADVVFAAIRSGGTAGRLSDERVALAHGLIGQETTGAGGISYALRSIPQMHHIAGRLAALAPEAWLINFTNPAGMVTEALLPVLGPRIIGICDSPIGLVRRAAAAAGVPLVRGSLAGVDYLGLNHLGWLRGLVHDGVDRLPGLLADPGRLLSFEEGRVFGATLPQLLGAVPNEYLFYYYYRREALAALSSGQTRGEFIAAQQQELYARLAGEIPVGSSAFDEWEAARRSREQGYLAEARSAGQDRDEVDLAGGGYEQVALELMHAALTGTRAELILNVRNGATVPALPADAVIEVPAEVDDAGARALSLPAPPTLHQLGLMSQLKAVERSVVEACATGAREAALQAFTLHPLIDSAHLAQRLLSGYEAAFPQLVRLWHRPGSRA